MGKSGYTFHHSSHWSALDDRRRCSGKPQRHATHQGLRQVMYVYYIYTDATVHYFKEKYKCTGVLRWWTYHFQLALKSNKMTGFLKRHKIFKGWPNLIFNLQIRLQKLKIAYDISRFYSYLAMNVKLTKNIAEWLREDRCHRLCCKPPICSFIHGALDSDWLA